MVGDPSGTSCPADAVIGSCTAAGQLPFRIEFEAAIGTVPTSTTVLVGYRSDVVSIPGSGASRDVRGRVAVAPPPPFLSTPTDLDYALRLIIVRTSPLAEGTLATVTFDRCSGAAAPTAADFGCYVEGCSGQGGPIEGCSCRIVDAN